MLVAALALLDVGGIFIWWSVADYEAASRAPASKADAAVVFFGDWGAQTQARVGKAVELLSSGKAGAIILAGGCRPAEDRDGGKLMTQMAVSRGADPLRLFPDMCSYDTRTNLVGAAEVATREHFTTFILISDALHLQRIRRLAHETPALAGAAEVVGQSSSPFWAWSRAHYEIAAVIVNALPAELGESVTRSFRDQPAEPGGAAP